MCCRRQGALQAEGKLRLPESDTKEAEVPSAFQHFGCLLPDLREDLADLDKIVERVLVEPRMKSRVHR